MEIDFSTACAIALFLPEMTSWRRPSAEDGPILPSRDTRGDTNTWKPGPFVGERESVGTGPGSVPLRQPSGTGSTKASPVDNGIRTSAAKEETQVARSAAKRQYLRVLANDTRILPVRPNVSAHRRPHRGRRLHAFVRQRLFPCDDLSKNNPPLLKISPLILRHPLEVGPHQHVESKGWEPFFLDLVG